MRSRIPRLHGAGIGAGWFRRSCFFGDFSLICDLERQLAKSAHVGSLNHFEAGRNGNRLRQKIQGTGQIRQDCSIMAIRRV